jgi:hypothetical protein
MGLWWQRGAFRHIRNWRLIWLPIFGLAAMYCFAFFFLRGAILRKTRFKFDNKMG